MGNSAQSRTARATPIPEATAVPVTHNSGTILIEQRLAEQTEEIRAQRAQLERLRAENARLQAENKRVASEANRFSLILVLLFCASIVIFYKYCTNGVFGVVNLKLHESPAFSKLPTPTPPQQPEGVEAVQTGERSSGRDSVSPSFSSGADLDRTDPASMYLAMRTLLLSAFNIALLLYGLGILISYAGFVAILIKLDMDKQYVAKFFAAFVFQYLFHSVGDHVAKNQEVQGSFIFICSIFSVFACFLEGNQIVLDRFILQRLRRRQNENSDTMRDMDWQIFAVYIGIICCGDSAKLPGYARFQDTPESKRKKYLRDGTFNLFIASFATGISCLYYYHVYKPFVLYLFIGFFFFFLSHVTVMLMLSLRLKQRSLVIWENLLFSYAGIALILHVFNTFVHIVEDSHLHYATVIYCCVPYMMLYPTLGRKGFQLNTDIHSGSATIGYGTFEMIVISILFMSLALTLQTHIFMLPHVVFILCFLVFQYGQHILVKRPSLYGGEVSENGPEPRQLTKAGKFFDVFTINTFVYLMLMLILNEFYRRTFRPHQDRYIMESFGWTGMAAPLQVVWKELARLAISLNICAGMWIVIRYALPQSLERNAISWVLALVMSSFAKYEAGTFGGTDGSKIIVYMYDVLTFACFCMSSTPANSDITIAAPFDMLRCLGMRFEKPTDLLFNCYYGLRLASVAPNLLGIPFSCIFIVPSILCMYFDLGASANVITRRSTEKVTKSLLSRILGLGMSLFIMVVAIQLQSKIYALVTCLGVYTFIASCCISLGANDSIRLIMFSICGFCTLLTARKLDMDFDYLSGVTLSSTPVYIKWIFTMVFGSISDNKKLPPIDLRLVEWLLGTVL